MALVVGTNPMLSGNVTTLIWIGARSPTAVEQSLGYSGGRLSQGYWIALLKDQLTSADFEFDGTTLRSGGRMGLPGATDAVDALRSRVHDLALQQRGAGGYQALQHAALTSVKLKGDQRIAKVIPAAAHNPAMAPDLQYPPGAGGLQWKILRPGKKFLIALEVSPSGMATAPGFSVNIGPGAPYDNRAKVMNYLRMA